MLYIPGFDRSPFRLGHLADLFIQGHLSQQLFHPALVFEIAPPVLRESIGWVAGFAEQAQRKSRTNNK